MPTCQGKAKSTGKRCTRSIPRGQKYCHDHGPDNCDLEEMDDKGRMTSAAFARHINRSRARVTQYVKSGIISRDSDGMIDVADATEALIMNSDLSQSDLAFEVYEPQAGPGAVSVGSDDGDLESEDFDPEELKRKRLVANVKRDIHRARIEKMKADEQAGRLVEAAEAERMLFEAARITRQQLMSVPDRVSAELAGLSDAADIYKVLEDELRAALDGLADDIEFGPEAKNSAA